MSDSGMLNRYGPWAIIAGGSEGIGAAIAERLAAQGFKLLLIARKPAPLEETAANVRQRHGAEIRTLSLDLTAPDAFDQIVQAAAGKEIGLLIYNAGADSSFDHFIDRPLEMSEKMVTLNVTTPMRLTHHFSRSMVARQKGGIILCSSLAGLAGRPTNGVYSAVKSFVNVFAEVLWFELGQKGIDVLAAILPTVRTPAMERLGLDFSNPKTSSDPFDIADEILAAIEKGPALHAGGSHERAMQLRAMPRDKAVRAMAGLPEPEA